MKFRCIVYSTLSVIFLIFSYLISSRLMMGLSPYLIFPNTFIVFISIYIGRKLPLYIVLGHTAVISFLFIVYLVVFGMLVDPLFHDGYSSMWAWRLQLLMSLSGLLLAWYLQISLYFLKNKNSNIKSV